MKRTFSLIMMSLLLAGTLFAQHRPQHNSTGINLSIWKNIATQRTDTLGSTWLNLGFYSSMNRLNGLALNILGSTIREDMNGVQLSGIYNIAGGNMRGVQMAGITNISGDNLSGVSLSGLVGIAGNHMQGIAFSGLTNITGDNSSGVAISGLLNIAGDKAVGLHLTGLANISCADFKGVTTSGLLNVVVEKLQGVQISGILNVTGENMTGVQISGIGNVAGSKAVGVQFAPFNMAMHVKGVQIGLVNYYKKQMEGFQLGLVNINPKTKVQLMLFGGNTTKLNVATRFKNQLFYTLLGGGTHYLDFNDKFSAAAFYRAGLELPLYKRLFVSGDLGYRHIETFKNKNDNYPARLYSLQTRVNLEYRLTNCLGIFVTGGYGWDRYYNRDANFDKGVIVEGGLVLLKY